MRHARHEPSVSLETLLAATEDGGRDEAVNSLLLLECDGSVFAIDASAVESIEEVSVIAPLPYPPASVVGVASVRGSMRLVVRLGRPAPTGRGRLVALSSDRNIAVYADHVIGVVTAGVEERGEAREQDGTPNRVRIDGRDVTLIDPATVIGM
jgi:chemotaxis signal transduction protein